MGQRKKTSLGSRYAQGQPESLDLVRAHFFAERSPMSKSLPRGRPRVSTTEAARVCRSSSLLMACSL